MTELKNNKNDILIFAVFSSVWIFLGWVAFLLSLGGFFYSWIIGGFFLFILTVIARQIILKKISFNVSREFAIISSAILIFVVLASFFVTPTIFSGRDQGSISEAAIRLSQNHKLEFSTLASSEFFKIYGSGKALNFPGFHYTQEGQLTTQFPLVYVSWLASFYSFFGLAGLIIANSVLLFIFLTSFYLLARNFVKEKFVYILLVLAATSFPVFWFFKFTLSENMALALLWISILWIYLFIKEQRLLRPSTQNLEKSDDPNKKNILSPNLREQENDKNFVGGFFYSSFLISAGLLVFTRIEGIFLLLSGFLTIFFFTRKNPFWRERKKFLIVYPAIFLAILLIMNFTKDFYFYKEIAKALFHVEQDQTGASSTLAGIFTPVISEFKVFFLYGIASSLLLGIFGVIWLWTKKQWEKMIPFFIILPSLVYLVNPWISSDHPWMLRRFVFSIIPVFLFYSVLFLQDWTMEEKMKHRKIVSWALIVIMIFSNLFIFFKYFTFSENKGLLQETQKISENFSRNDLVLVDRSAVGDGWTMITGPMNFLYNINTVYLFNPKDVEKIDRSRFEKIYLIASNQNIQFFVQSLGKENLINAKDYSIKNEKLSNFGDFFLPEKETYRTNGKIFEIK